MSVSVEITVKDAARPAVQNLIAGMEPARVQPIVGRSARNVYREHLFGMNQTRPNALGGRRTNFYATAARGTSFRIQGEYVVISIASVGIRQRYYGGTIKPKTKKFLTIPAIPEAHGKRASEFPGLHFSVEYNPKVNARMPALVMGTRSLIRTRKTKGGVKVYAGGVEAKRVYFWLARQVTQKGDVTVLPYPELVQSRVNRDLLDYGYRLWARSVDGRRANGGSN